MQAPAVGAALADEIHGIRRLQDLQPRREVMRPFQPAPPPGVRSPFEWGREERVRERLGDAFELEIEEHVSTLRIPTGEDYWQLFSSSYGPTKSAAEALDDERREEFHRTWVDFFETRYRSNGEIAHEREYLLVLGTRRA